MASKKGKQTCEHSFRHVFEHSRLIEEIGWHFPAFHVESVQILSSWKNTVASTDILWRVCWCLFQPASDAAMPISTSLLWHACLFYSDDFLVTIPQPCSQAASVPHLEGISCSKSSGYASSPGQGGGCSLCKCCVLVDKKLRGLKIWRGWGVHTWTARCSVLCMYVFACLSAVVRIVDTELQDITPVSCR